MCGIFCRLLHVSLKYVFFCFIPNFIPRLGVKSIGFGPWYPKLRIPRPLRIQWGWWNYFLWAEKWKNKKRSCNEHVWYQFFFFFLNFLKVKFLSVKASVRNTMFHVKAYRYYILEHLFLQDKSKCNFQPSQFLRHLPWKRWILSWFLMKTWCGTIMVSSCHIWSVYCCIIFLLLTFLLLTDNGC